MPDFDLTGELSLKIELHMLRPITEKVHSGNGPVSLVLWIWSEMFKGTQKSQFSFSRDHCCEITVKNVRKSIFSMF